MYTTSTSGKGNEELTNPVGLITADEVAMAGGVWAIGNTSYYLYNNENYWTFSPYQVDSENFADVFVLSSSGALINNSVQIYISLFRQIYSIFIYYV